MNLALATTVIVCLAFVSSPVLASASESSCYSTITKCLYTDDIFCGYIDYACGIASCGYPTEHFNSGCDLLNYYDTNNDCIISKSEVDAAVSSYVTGKLTDQEIAIIVKSYDSGNINNICENCCCPPYYLPNLFDVIYDAIQSIFKPYGDCPAPCPCPCDLMLRVCPTGDEEITNSTIDQLIDYNAPTECISCLVDCYFADVRTAKEVVPDCYPTTNTTPTPTTTTVTTTVTTTTTTTTTVPTTTTTTIPTETTTTTTTMTTIVIPTRIQPLEQTPSLGIEVVVAVLVGVSYIVVRKGKLQQK